MAIDADGNFYNPYSPGSYEYEMEESNRYQEPGTGGVVTTAQTPDILRVQQAAPPPGFNTFNQVTSIILSVATLAVPGLGEMIGAQILEGLGITTATAAVEAGVGAAALSAGSTAAQGGSFNDVLKGAATAGFATGINVGMGGGVAGAATGSLVGSAIQGGSVDQVLVNAVAAGAGAGVQGVLGPAAGTIVRDLIKTGEVSDRTLINAAVSEISAWNKTGDRKAPIVEGQPMAVPTEAESVPERFSLEPQAETPTEAETPVPTDATVPGGPTLDTQTITATSPTISPVVTDLDLVRQVSQQQQPTVTPQALEQVIVQGQGSNVAPVETGVTSETVPSTAAVATPTPEQPFPTPTITPIPGQEEEEAPVVTDVSSTTLAPEAGFEEYQPLPDRLDSVTVQAFTKTPAETEVKAEEPKKEEPKKETKKLYPTITSVPTPRRSRQPIITGASPARLLADALSAYRPAGAIEGEESGKERQNVWNEKSLRLKDALGL